MLSFSSKTYFNDPKLVLDLDPELFVSDPYPAKVKEQIYWLADWLTISAMAKFFYFSLIKRSILRKGRFVTRTNYSGTGTYPGPFF